MTREEWRAGFIRLLLVLGGLLGAALMIAVPFAVAGRSALSAFGTACGVVSVPLFVGGIVSHMRGEYRTRHAASALDDRELARQERREGDRLSLGLFGLGAAFFAIALTLA